LKGRIPFIVNDRVDVARPLARAGAFGQDDFPLFEARKLLGSRAIIGLSCQNAAHVRRAFIERADYVGFGPVFKTLTKPEPALTALMKWPGHSVCRREALPFLRSAVLHGTILQI